MHALTICFGPNGQIWKLFYKSETAAVAMRETARAAQLGQASVDLLHLEDEFGQSFDGDPGMVHGIILEDLDQSLLATVAYMLHNERIRAEAVRAAQADPKIKMAMMAQGPSMLSPMGMGNGRGGFS